MAAEPTPVKSVRAGPEIERSRNEALRRRAEKENSGRELRTLQKNAMAALERSGWESAIIIMPTGSGKTTLVWSFTKKDECAIVFAPYRLLADQLVLVLAQHGKTFQWPLTEQQGSIDLLLASAQFVVISFERAPDCVGLITQLQQRRRLGPIWVDEVGPDICLL